MHFDSLAADDQPHQASQEKAVKQRNEQKTGPSQGAHPTYNRNFVFN